MNAKLSAITSIMILFCCQILAHDHGFATLGDLKYPKDFKHFDYVNPDAPKGGILKLHTIGSFDNLNPFILKGHAAADASIIYDSLMTGAGDEIDSLYGLLAESVTLAEDRSHITFTLRQNARWHDNQPITIEDVIFSYETLKEFGTPGYRLLLKQIKEVTQIGDRQVRFVFTTNQNRDLPALAAGMPVIAKHYYKNHVFDETTLKPPLGSGPYRFGEIIPGKSVTYERVADYWGKDLPVNVGMYNFDKIKIDYYRDREVAFEAFKSGEYDIRQEFRSKSWATEYNFPAAKTGKVVLNRIKDNKPTGLQGSFMNLRRAKFQDRKVRKAINLALDFEWLNKNIFYGQYKRTLSVYEVSPMAANDPISDAEKELLIPFKDIIPEEVFKEPFHLPVHDGNGRIRESLREANQLLDDAGWTIKKGKRVNQKGEAFTIEFLLYEPSLKRIYLPLIQNLEKLGITANIRMVDSTDYQKRFERHDFDIISIRLGHPLAPGLEQERYWGSKEADLPGSPNVSGIKNPAIDSLILKLLNSKSYPELITIAKALDRVIMWEYYFIPSWYQPYHNMAYWNKFGYPENLPPYANMVGSNQSSPIGNAIVWWYDEKKDKNL